MNHKFEWNPNKQPPKVDKEDLGKFQICYNSEDPNPQIKNKKFILNKGYSLLPCMLTYEKHFTRNDKKVVEYYTNDILDTYFETTRKGNMEIVEGFGAAGGLFTREKKHFKDGKHIKSEIRIQNADGTTLRQTDYH